MGFLLKDALRILCAFNQWAYAVFWRISYQNPKLLIWEEHHCEEPPPTHDQTRCEIQIENVTSLLVSQMMMESDVVVVGQGVVGRSALTGKYGWFSPDNCFKSSNNPEVFSEMSGHFSFGVKTLCIIPVIPHGVVQFGSFFSIPETLSFVNDVRSLILQFGSPRSSSVSLTDDKQRTQCSFDSINKNSVSLSSSSIKRIGSRDEPSFGKREADRRCCDDDLFRVFNSAGTAHADECTTTGTNGDPYDAVSGGGTGDWSGTRVSLNTGVVFSARDDNDDDGGDELLEAVVSSSQSTMRPEQSQQGSVLTGDSKKDVEPCAKSNRKRAKPPPSVEKPRPKDRQMIQDRLKELREIVPYGAKCSIDALLERTIKHMLFLQSVTKHADKMKQSGALKESGSGSGATWAYELCSQSVVCPIMVEDLNPPRQLLVRISCEKRGLFLEIADMVRGLGLTILNGVIEDRNGRVWARFAVEANKDVTRMELFMSLIHLMDDADKSVRKLDSNACVRASPSM